MHRREYWRGELDWQLHRLVILAICLLGIATTGCEIVGYSILDRFGWLAPLESWWKRRVVNSQSRLSQDTLG